MPGVRLPPFHNLYLYICIYEHIAYKNFVSKHKSLKITLFINYLLKSLYFSFKVLFSFFYSTSITKAGKQLSLIFICSTRNNSSDNHHLHYYCYQVNDTLWIFYILCVQILKSNFVHLCVSVYVQVVKKGDLIYIRNYCKQLNLKQLYF